MLADRSMPLCMRVLHKALRREHKLKHWGRLQYGESPSLLGVMGGCGLRFAALVRCPPTHSSHKIHTYLPIPPPPSTGLFLKGVGLSLEDALRFWEQEFTKIMTADVFNKQVDKSSHAPPPVIARGLSVSFPRAWSSPYDSSSHKPTQYAYSVRHYFGKEGRRKDYTPYNCSKVILGPGPGHGYVPSSLPFRSFLSIARSHVPTCTYQVLSIVPLNPFRWTPPPSPKQTLKNDPHTPQTPRKPNDTGSSTAAPTSTSTRATLTSSWSARASRSGTATRCSASRADRCVVDGFICGGWIYMRYVGRRVCMPCGAWCVLIPLYT